MSIQELYEWREYYLDEPFSADRIEIQLATLSQLVAGFGGNKLEHSDFMLSVAYKQEKSSINLEDKIKKAFGV